MNCTSGNYIGMMIGNELVLFLVSISQDISLEMILCPCDVYAY